MFKNKNQFLVIISLFILILATIISWRGGTIRNILESILYDNKSHNFLCGQLPTLDVVESTMKAHKDKLDMIVAVGESVIVSVDDQSCPGKADVTFFYSSHAEREAIQAIIGDELFFGVPYNLRNY